jgi:acyl carrier protein
MTQQFIEVLNRVNPDILEKPDANLIEDGIIDSLDIMRLVAELEQEFGIDFDPNDVIAENFASAEAMWALVQKTQGAS